MVSKSRKVFAPDLDVRDQFSIALIHSGQYKHEILEMVERDPPSRIRKSHNAHHLERRRKRIIKAESDQH
jgi:hypothetical protein